MISKESVQETLKLSATLKAELDSIKNALKSINCDVDGLPLDQWANKIRSLAD